MTVNVLRFEPTHFLEEAVVEFLESGVDSKKMASCVVKTATATELLLKESLETICPALILDKIDPAALQVVLLYDLRSKMLSPKALEKTELRTATFQVILNRVAMFHDIAKMHQSLLDLHELRNSLIHHRGEIEIWKVNLLLIKVFAFLQEFTKAKQFLRFKITEADWKRLAEIEKTSTDAFSVQLSKTLAYYAKLSTSVSGPRVKTLVETRRALTRDEEVQAEDLECPACHNKSMDVLIETAVDYDRYGNVENGFRFLAAECRVCDLELDELDLEHIGDNYDKFFKTAEGKENWKAAAEMPEFEDFYP